MSRPDHQAPRRRELARTSQAFDPGGWAGLSEDESRRRLAEEGPNELPTQQKKGIFRTAFEVAREPMFVMLVAAGGLYLTMGEAADAAMLLGFVFVVMGITIVQERRTERALEALRDLASPRALVIRDGVRRRVAGREVVRGDLVVLGEGDRVPADGLLRRGLNLSSDESLLTGESVPVRKRPSLEATAIDRPGGDDLPSTFSGTLITAGQGVMEVTATGGRSELGRIGKALAKVEQEPTLLQQQTGRLVRSFAVAGLLACAVVVVAYGWTRGGGAGAWREGLLAGIAMAMATLPEEFPVVLTVFLALGAWRISRADVLTRRMPAIETLGAATVLCVDKTGTLTRNQMTLRALATAERTTDLATLAGSVPQEHRELLEHAALACKPEPFDPMERAILAATPRADGAPRRSSSELIREYALAPELLAVSHAWRDPSGAAVIATKGAPEAVADLCHLPEAERGRLMRQAADLASRGLRVLGVARGRARADELPAEHHQLSLELLGLVGLEDPLRPAVPAAVAECQAAGVRVVMITGDYPVTARSIAREAGLVDPDAIVTGPELDRLSEEELARRVRDVSVFARVVPEQKLRIVQALKANTEIVAMTGDGVNDAPALKAAHIGIAMGGRGTDVAREAAALVLLDDDFSSIVAAIRLGRRIFDNIKKAVGLIFAVHVPIAGLSMLPVFFGDWPLLLLPVHIVFLELIIDPSCSLVFEAEEAEPDVMRRPPRRPDERLFTWKTLGTSIVQGASALAACLGVFLFARADHSPEAARALTFTALVVAFVTIILVNRSWTRSAVAMLRVPNAALRWVIGGACVFLALALTVPGARGLFRFAPLHPRDLLLSLGVGLACVLWFELLKLTKNLRLGARRSQA